MRQVTKVVLSCEFPGTAGVVLALAHPNLSQPFAVFPCWVLVLALAAGARGAVSQGALCDMSGSGRAGALQPPRPWQCRSILCMACRVLPAPPRVKSLWFCCQALGNSYPLQVPRGLLCLAFLTFLLRMCTKKSRGQPSNFWVVNELLLPSPPCLTLSCREIELRIPGEENSLMIPP